RGPGKGLLRGHSRSPGGIGPVVLRGGDARNSPVESRPRAPDSALQVLRLPDGLVSGAGASATRCPAHPAAASAPHRAGGSTYVRSVTLQRRTWRGAVEAPRGARAAHVHQRAQLRESIRSLASAASRLYSAASAPRRPARAL